VRSVCDVGANLSESRGQIVTVRGVYIDFYHGRSLFDRRCPRVSVPLWITNSTREHDDYKAFFDAWLARPSRHDVLATFVGRLQQHNIQNSIGEGEVSAIFLDVDAVSDLKVVESF
jgi:hypothetical protein